MHLIHDDDIKMFLKLFSTMFFDCMVLVQPYFARGFFLLKASFAFPLSPSAFS